MHVLAGTYACGVASWELGPPLISNLNFSCSSETKPKIYQYENIKKIFDEVHTARNKIKQITVYQLNLLSPFFCNGNWV